VKRCSIPQVIRKLQYHYRPAGREKKSDTTNAEKNMEQQVFKDQPVETLVVEKTVVGILGYVNTLYFLFIFTISLKLL
jgi:hypothetical protein